jgi:hypothetical protein
MAQFFGATDMGKNSSYPWSITKRGSQPLLHRDRTQYEHYERAEKVYSQWMAGISDEEIASFFEIELADVLRDVQHTQQILPVRTVIAHLHDRNRILILKAEGDKYQKLLSQSLETPASEYIKNGVSPTSVMKEYRECTGMTEKPGSMINITKNTANFGGGAPGEIPLANFGSNGRPRSFEHLLRMIVAADPSCSLSPPTDIAAKEIEAPDTPQAEKKGEEEPRGNDCEGG